MASRSGRIDDPPKMFIARTGAGLVIGAFAEPSKQDFGVMFDEVLILREPWSARPPASEEKREASHLAMIP